MSIASPRPVMTSSQTRSVSRPDQPALALIPFGGVRVESADAPLTTAMCAPVWDAISSRRPRTSVLIVGLVAGVSRISERGTLMPTWDCACVRGQAVSRVAWQTLTGGHGAPCTGSPS